MKIKKQNILINNAGAGFLISSTGVIYSTGAWGCSHQIYYSFSASVSLLRIHSLLITISSSSRRSLKSVQCEEANSYILSMSTAPVISPLLMIIRIFVPSSTAKRSSSNSLSGLFLRIESAASNLTSSIILSSLPASKIWIFSTS